MSKVKLNLKELLTLNHQMNYQVQNEVYFDRPLILSRWWLTTALLASWAQGAPLYSPQMV